MTSELMFDKGLLYTAIIIVIVLVFAYQGGRAHGLEKSEGKAVAWQFAMVPDQKYLVVAVISPTSLVLQSLADSSEYLFVSMPIRLVNTVHVDGIVERPKGNKRLSLASRRPHHQKPTIDLSC